MKQRRSNEQVVQGQASQLPTMPRSESRSRHSYHRFVGSFKYRSHRQPAGGKRPSHAGSVLLFEIRIVALTSLLVLSIGPRLLGSAEAYYQGRDVEIPKQSD